MALTASMSAEVHTGERDHRGGALGNGRFEPNGIEVVVFRPLGSTNRTCAPARLTASAVAKYVFEGTIDLCAGADFVRHQG